MKTEHELKLDTAYFGRVASGQKTFEIRRNDRDFQVGDILLLKEYDPQKGWPDHGSYDVIRAEVTYMTSYEQKEGFVVLGIRVLPDEEPAK